MGAGPIPREPAQVRGLDESQPVPPALGAAPEAPGHPGEQRGQGGLGPHPTRKIHVLRCTAPGGGTQELRLVLEWRRQEPQVLTRILLEVHRLEEGIIPSVITCGDVTLHMRKIRSL